MKNNKFRMAAVFFVVALLAMNFIPSVDANDFLSEEECLKKSFVAPIKCRIIYSNEDAYEGEVRSGKKEGKGKYMFSNGAVYEGEFRNDKYDGHGKLTRADGAVYEGEFMDGKKHGKGKYTPFNGAVFGVEYDNGVPVTDIFEDEENQANGDGLLSSINADNNENGEYGQTNDLEIKDLRSDLGKFSRDATAMTIAMRSMINVIADTRLYGNERIEKENGNVEKGGLWSGAHVSFGKIEGSGTEGRDIIFGFDHRFNSRFKLGIAYAMARTSLKNNALEIKTNILSLYSRFDIIENLYLNNTIVFGFGKNENSNNSRRKSHSTDLTSLLGYNLYLGRFGNLSPEISLGYVRINEDGNNKDNNRLHALASTLGFSYRAPLVLKNLGTSLRLAYSHNINGSEELNEINSALELGLSLNYSISRTLDLSLSYDGRYSSKASNSGFGLGLVWRL
jgi:hypothetical protein